MLHSTLSPAADGYLSNSPYRTLLPAVSGYLTLISIITTPPTPFDGGGPSGGIVATEPAHVRLKRKREDEEIQTIIMLSIIYGMLK